MQMIFVTNPVAAALNDANFVLEPLVLTELRELLFQQVGRVEAPVRHEQGLERVLLGG